MASKSIDWDGVYVTKDADSKELVISLVGTGGSQGLPEPTPDCPDEFVRHYNNTLATREGAVREYVPLNMGFSLQQFPTLVEEFIVSVSRNRATNYGITVKVGFARGAGVWDPSYLPDPVLVTIQPGETNGIAVVQIPEKSLPENAPDGYWPPGSTVGVFELFDAVILESPLPVCGDRCVETSICTINEGEAGSLYFDITCNGDATTTPVVMGLYTCLLPDPLPLPDDAANGEAIGPVIPFPECEPQDCSIPDSEIFTALGQISLVSETPPSILGIGSSTQYDIANYTWRRFFDDTPDFSTGPRYDFLTYSETPSERTTFGFTTTAAQYANGVPYIVSGSADPATTYCGQAGSLYGVSANFYFESEHTRDATNLFLSFSQSQGLTTKNVPCPVSFGRPSGTYYGGGEIVVVLEPSTIDGTRIAWTPYNAPRVVNCPVNASGNLSSQASGSGYRTDWSSAILYLYWRSASSHYEVWTQNFDSAARPGYDANEVTEWDTGVRIKPGIPYRVEVNFKGETSTTNYYSSRPESFLTPDWYGIVRESKSIITIEGEGVTKKFTTYDRAGWPLESQYSVNWTLKGTNPTISGLAYFSSDAPYLKNTTGIAVAIGGRSEEEAEAFTKYMRRLSNYAPPSYCTRLP